MNDFAFIAFNHETGLPLAHGRTAAHAAAAADQLAPDAALYVLDAHHAGPWIWAERVALGAALKWDAMRARDVA
ncbi:hypothetical protein [Acidocella sp.]|jgi:hypothetical protein|uniref:hypothetical protein n=1 Tax=Acidocella sp. TaxID=50710 RepID=UPI0026095AE9|nr:hypothetical protein [Acidocella sp.]MDD2794666.1 hypothetical protein [Acidocella sp.]